MGFFRFRRRAGFLGGLFHLNFSKTGISASVGVPGATLNVPVLSARKRNPAITLGLPGTGLSYRQELSGRPPATSAQPDSAQFTATFDDASPEKQEAVVEAVKQVAAMTDRKVQIGEWHDVATTQADIDRHVQIRYRRLKSGPVFQVIDRADQHIMSEHATDEQARQWIAENVHVHIKKIEAYL